MAGSVCSLPKKEGINGGKIMENLKQFSLAGKTAIVTGGAGGLGRGMAKGLSEAGANVVISGRNVEKMEKVAKEITEATGNKVVTAIGDVRYAEQRENILNTALENFGQVDILVNAAGNQLRIPALDYNEEDWASIIDVQLTGVFFMSQLVAKAAIKKGNKLKIINIASLNSRFGFQQRTAYVAAKGAIVQLTKTLANEWAQYNIFCNAMAPGYFNTEMTACLFEDPEWSANLMRRLAIKRGGEPEDMAGLTVFLASDASDYITGETVYIDGGYSVC